MPDRARFFRRKVFAPEVWEIGQKYGFLNLKKNLITIKKITSFFCIPAQIPYMGKIFCLRYRPKCSKPIRLQKTAWNSMKQPHFGHVDKKKFTKFKSWLKMSYLSMARNGCGQAGLWTLKLTVSQEWPDGINWFFASWYKFTQIKRWMSGHGQK